MFQFHAPHGVRIAGDKGLIPLFIFVMPIFIVLSFELRRGPPDKGFQNGPDESNAGNRRLRDYREHAQRLALGSNQPHPQVPFGAKADQHFVEGEQQRCILTATEYPVRYRLPGGRTLKLLLKWILPARSTAHRQGLQALGRLAVEIREIGTVGAEGVADMPHQRFEEVFPKSGGQGPCQLQHTPLLIRIRSGARGLSWGRHICKSLQFPVGQELKFQAGLRGDLEMGLTGSRQHGTTGPTDECSDACTLSAACNTAYDCAQTSATNDLPCRLLPLSRRLGLREAGSHWVRPAIYFDGIDLQFDQVASLHLAALLHLGGHEHDICSALHYDVAA